MPEQITEQNRELAIVALLRAAAFYRSVANEIMKREPDLMRHIMSKGGWTASEASDAVIKEWSDFLEVRDV